MLDEKKLKLLLRDFKVKNCEKDKSVLEKLREGTITEITEDYVISKGIKYEYKTDENSHKYLKGKGKKIYKSSFLRAWAYWLSVENK